MSDESTILWNLYAENWNQARHHETQRSTMTSLVVVVSGAIITLVTSDKYVNIYDLPLTYLLIVLGVFGALFSAKQYERSQAHIQRARCFRAELEKSVNIEIASRNQVADDLTKKEFPRSSRWRLNTLWVALHGMIALLGIVLMVMIALNRNTDSCAAPNSAASACPAVASGPTAR